MNGLSIGYFLLSRQPPSPLTTDLSPEDIELLQSALFSSTAYSGNPASADSAEPAPNPTWDDGQDAVAQPAADAEAASGQGKVGRGKG